MSRRCRVPQASHFPHSATPWARWRSAY